MPKYDDLARLRENLLNYFSLSELQILCFELRIPYENLPGDTLPVKMLQLILYLEQRQRIPELLEWVSKQRPNVAWAIAPNEYADLRRPGDHERELLDGARDRAGVVVALNSLSQIAHAPEDYEDALELFARGLEGARKTREKAEAAVALNYVAGSLQARGRLDQALDLYQASLTLWRKAGERSGEASTLNNIGRIYQSLGRMSEAREFLEEGLEIVRLLGNRLDEAAALQNLGNLSRAMGDLQAALDALAQSEQIWETLGGKAGLSIVLRDMGAILLSMGDVSMARDKFQQALALFRETGNIRDEASTLASLGQVATLLAQWDEAQRLNSAALQIYEKLGEPRDIAATLTNLGNVNASLRKWDKALDYYQRAQALARRADDRASEAAALGNIGNVWIEKGELDNALNVYQQALEIQKQVGDTAGLSRTQDAINAIYRRREEAARPLSLLISEAQRFFQAAGFTLGTTGEVSSFICQPATPLWKQKVKCDVYACILAGQPLDGNIVLRIRNTVQNMPGSLTKAFVLVDKIVQDDAWLQIAALRAAKFDVVPVPVSLLYEGKMAGKVANEGMALSKYLERFLGRGYDPYDLRDPVSDVLNFFGRETLANELKDRLMAGRPIGLFGLRKMGKSSLMQFMQNLMPCPTARLDLQAGVNLTELYERVLRAWNTEAQSRFSLDLGLRDVKLNGAADPSPEFVTIAQNTLDKLATQNPEGRLAIFLDEIELIMPPAEATGPALERYLALMRTLRGLLQEDGRLSLMVVGVDPFVNRVIRWGNEQNPFYQLLQEVYLPPLRDDDCTVMIRNVGGRVELSYSDATAAYIAQASGGHPFLARQLCSLAYKQRNQQPGEVPLQSVQAAVERFLFDPQYSTPTLGDNGLWSEIGNVKLWGEQAARANQSVLLALAQSATPLREIDIANDPDAALKRSALLALQQLSVIRSVEDTSNQPDSRYMITFGLFCSWIRRVRLGLKE